MGFRFRKSWSSGPFRITASKSGLSYSFGVKGARVNVSRRGTYVTFGSNGIYYQKRVSKAKSYSNVSKDDQTSQPVPYYQHTITSGNVGEITGGFDNFICHIEAIGKLQRTFVHDDNLK